MLEGERKVLQMAAQTATKPELQDEIDELQETIDQIGDLVSDALDPALSREEVIAKLQDIDDLLNDEDTSADDDEDDELSDDDDDDEDPL